MLCVISIPQASYPIPVLNSIKHMFSLIYKHIITTTTKQQGSVFSEVDGDTFHPRCFGRLLEYFKEACFQESVPTKRHKLYP